MYIAPSAVTDTAAHVHAIFAGPHYRTIVVIQFFIQANSAYSTYSERLHYQSTNVSREAQRAVAQASLVARQALTP